MTSQGRSLRLFSSQRHRHPCSEKPSVVSDIGLRLSEGIQDLKLEQQLAPTREAISRTLAAGSTNFFNAVAGVRERWMQRSASSDSSSGGLTKVNSRGSIVSEAASPPSRKGSVDFPRTDAAPPAPPAKSGGLRPLSIVGAQAQALEAQKQQQQPPPPVPSTFGGWGASVGSFFSQRAARLSVSSSRPPSIAGVSRGSSPAPPPVPPVPSNKDVPEVPPEDEAILQPRNLDEVYQHQHKQQEEEQQHQQHQHPELDAALATALAQDPVKAKVKDSDAISTISSGDTGFAM